MYTTLHYITTTATATTTTTLLYATQDYTTLYYTTVRYTTLHYTNYTTPQLQLQLRYTNYTTLQLQLHYTTITTTTTTALHHTTSSSCGCGDRCNHLQPLRHPCMTTTHLSYSVLSLKLPPPPCAVLLVNDIEEVQAFLCCGTTCLLASASTEPIQPNV